MRPLYLFDRWGAMVDTIPWPLKAIHTDELNGKDLVELSVVGDEIEKDQRIVWRDMYGDWHEHIVKGPDTDHDGSILTDTKCDSCLYELALIYLDDVRAEGTPDAILRTLLEGTRFTVGAIEVERSTKKFTWHHVSIREALEDVVEAIGGELLVSVTVSGAEVTRRVVSLLADRGHDNGCLFTYGNNLKGISRKVSEDDIYTRVYPYGAGLPRTNDEGALTGGYTPKISIADVNDGKDYLDDDAAKERYGLPDGHGGKRHAEGKVEFSGVRDKMELKALGLRALEIASKPQASYSGKVVTFEEAGLTGGDSLQVGDTVHVRDVDLDERLTTRVLKITRDIMAQNGYPVTREPEITLGNLLTTITELIQSQQGDVDYLEEKTGGLDADVTDINDRSHDWDDTSDIVDTAPGEWLKKVMDRLNQEFDAAKTYKFSSFERGDIWANGPLTAEGKPTGDTDSAINLNGLGFRIASKVANGDFVWEVFGTGEGFTASLINVGTLRCGDNYLNLDTGEMRIALTAKVGIGSTGLSDYVQNVSNTAASNAKSDAVSEADRNTRDYLEDYVAIDSFDSYLTMRNTFNALTHNGADKGFFIQGEHVFVCGDYVRTGILESRNEQSVWDLDNGYFETSSSGFSGGQYHNISTRIAGGQYAVKMDETDIGTISTYSQGNVHPYGVKTLTDLVLCAPNNIGVGFTPTTQSGISYTPTMRSGTITYVTAVSGGGDSSVSVSRQSLYVTHGMITGTAAAAASLDATWSTPLAEHIALAACTETLDGIGAGGAVPVERVTSTAQLMEAADASHPVWQVEPETLELGMPVYTGEEWTMGIPVEDPRDDDPDGVELPTTAYVSAQAALIQSEIEAVARSIGDTALTARLAKARVAMTAGTAAAMTKAAGEVNDGRTAA